MDLILYYLIGCLAGFGITHTFTIPYKEDGKMSDFRLYIYGTLSSWLTVIVFLIGVFVGFVRRFGGDAD